MAPSTVVIRRLLSPEAVPEGCLQSLKKIEKHRAKEDSKVF